MTASAPDAIGPYRISGVLGQGAMGIVYVGTHVRTGATAAIKTVYEHEASRFRQIRREVRALARLDHPGVVRILDHGASDGLPWYAMERLEGTTLKDVFDRLWQSSANARDAVTRLSGNGVTAESIDATHLDPPNEEGSATLAVDTRLDRHQGIGTAARQRLSRRSGGRWEPPGRADHPAGGLRNLGLSARRRGAASRPEAGQHLHPPVR